MINISDFQTKDVVNVIDGKNLGQINDLELDLRTGRVEAIVVPGPSKFFGMFSAGNDIVIPWKNIVKIGLDVVLVKFDASIRHAEENPRNGNDRFTPDDQYR
jgi:YlmC/YmxH family sporulation protein